MNRVELLGRIGSDLELKQTTSGISVCNFSVATSEKYTKKDGERVEETEWHNITAWGKTAEVLCQYVEKGNRIFINGKIKTEKYEKDGEPRTATKVVLSGFEFIDGKVSSEDDRSTHKGNEHQTYSGTDDDLPF